MSTEHDHIKAATQALDKAKYSLGAENIDFALLFTTEEFSHPLVLQTISNSIGPLPVLGASAQAVIAQDSPLKHGLIIILFSLGEGVYFNAACVKEMSAKTRLAAGIELGEKLLYGCKDVRRNFSIVFSDTTPRDYPAIVAGMQEKLGRSFPLIGASVPAGLLDHQKNPLYFGAEIFNNACCGLLWGGKVNFGLGTEHGWQPLGKPRHVTKAEADTVYEIDGEPAANLYKAYFAKEIPELKKDLSRLAVFYPVGIAVSEKKEYLLRSLSAMNDDGSLVFKGEVPQKSAVRLMISSKESCLSSTAVAAQTALSALKGRKIKFTLVLNSFSRYALLGRAASQEIKLVRDILGADAPLAGIYTSAEQAPLNSINYNNLGKSYIHNNSIAVLAIAE